MARQIRQGPPLRLAAGASKIDLVNAEALTRALDGRWYGSYGVARCPAHDDRNPSLTIRDGDDKVLIWCQAACDQDAVIGALKARGLWTSGDTHQRHYRPVAVPETHRKVDALHEARRSQVAHIWRQTGPAAGSLIARYMASRGIITPLPPDLHFHPDLRHLTGVYAPAMVAAVRNVDGVITGLHRTWLREDGDGKANLSPSKAMLGPCRGGAVRLGTLGHVLMVGEGIETCLSAMQATGNPAWAALSTSGLRALDLPDAVHDVIVLADGDDPGEAAAREAAMRWKREGRSVRVARPPQGLDFNDMLSGRTPHIKASAA